MFRLLLLKHQATPKDDRLFCQFGFQLLLRLCLRMLLFGFRLGGLSLCSACCSTLTG